MNRKTEGSVIAAAVLGAIVAIMTMVTAWGSHKDCDGKAFPHIIGCALGSYENLSGGLIAAGGALFAGWLAWSAVKEQIRLEKRKLLEAKIAQLQQRAEDVSKAVSETKDAYANGLYLHRLLHEELKDPTPNASKLADLWRRGCFPISSQGWQSRAFGTALWDAAARVRDMGREIEQGGNMHTADQRHSYLVTREADAQEAREAFGSILANMPTTISQLESQLADENRQVTSAQSELGQLPVSLG